MGIGTISRVGTKEKIESALIPESSKVASPVRVVGKSVVARHQQVDRVDLRRLPKNNCDLNNGFLNKYFLSECLVVAATLLMLAAMFGKERFM